MEGIQKLLILIVGKKHSGKTSDAKRLAEKTPLKTIVVNTTRHPAYSDFEEINAEQLKTWNGKRCVVLIADESEADKVAKILDEYQGNAFVIFEDARKYVRQDLGKPFERLIINHRMRCFYLVFMYHFLKQVPPNIAGNYEVMYLHKTNDGSVNLGAKYGNWDCINRKREQINRNKNEHYCEVIFDYES